MKKLREESVPLITFFTNKFPKGNDKIQIIHKMGSQSYDVQVYNSNIPNLDYIEIGDSTMNREGAARMEVLNNEGSVFTGCPVTITGSRNKGDRKVYIEGMPIPEDQSLKKVVNEVKGIIIKKEFNANKYPINTGLLVHFNDHFFHREKERKFFQELLPSIEAIRNFSYLFLVGASGKVFREFSLSQLS